MRSKLLWLVVVLALVAGTTTAVFLGLSGDDSSAPSAKPTPTASATSSRPTPSPTPVSLGDPQRLKVEGIGVNAPVLAMGTAADGSQEVPTTLTDTSWWRHGGTPGGPGNTVITGHAAHLATQHGVFDDLGELSVGDSFQIVAETGTATYTVTKRLDIPRAEFADHATNIYRRNGPSGAVLMTCASWDGHVWDSTMVIWAAMTQPAVA